MPSAPAVRESSIPWVLVSATLLLTTACGGRRSSPPAVTTVLSTVPVDGATDVEPDTTITLQLSVRDGGLLPGDVTVHDGGNELPGSLERIGQSQLWRWTPDQELPRGNRIRVRSSAQGEVAAFSVREASQREVFELPGEFPMGTLSWPNGRRAVVMASGRVFEVTDGALVERFVALSQWAWTFGDGSFVQNELSFSGFLVTNYCVRGNLDGTTERIPTPYAREVSSIDSNGDAVLFVPSLIGNPSEHGIWRMMHDEFVFELAGPLELDAPFATPCIDGSGAVSLAYAQAGEVRFARFVRGDLVGERYTISSDAGTPQHAVGLGGGSLIAWTHARNALAGIEHSLHLARYEPGIGVRLVATNAGSWTTYLLPGTAGFANVGRVRVADHGSSVVPVDVYQSGVSSGPTLADFVRVEADDRYSGIENYSISYPGLNLVGYRASWSPGRCEMWTVSNAADGSALDLRRSRPGEPLEPARRLYDVSQPGLEIGTWFYSFDDSGRAVVAVTEYGGPSVLTRIVRVD